MIDVVSIKFKNRGKCYYFNPNGLAVKTGEKVIVETAKGLEIADCWYGVHAVEETAVVQPLRPVIRIASKDDLRVAEINTRREREAFEICQKKISEHGLDMKLVDVECNFEGNKTTFFFTSDGRVDFRDLVKDLAGIFRNRIELRQIGVRDEAKMLGGIGICGRPYCCHQFLDEFQPVSTKMAKVQSLSLNPTKISGSCGRLMCCLRYEQDAYEDLMKKVPKQGAYVETTEGYGVAEQINLLRQTVKVKLDKATDDSLQVFKACEVATVPGGRPKDGEVPPSVLKYVPQEEEDEEIVLTPNTDWDAPSMVADEPKAEKLKTERRPKPQDKRRPRNGRPQDRKPRPAREDKPAEVAKEAPKPQKAAAPQDKKEEGFKKARNNNRRNMKFRKVEGEHPAPKSEKLERSQKPQREDKPQTAKSEGIAKSDDKPKKNYNNRRRNYHHKPRPQGNKPESKAPQA